VTTRKVVTENATCESHQKPRKLTDPTSGNRTWNLKPVAVIAIGWIFVVLGIAGLFLPVLQGILFLLIGLSFCPKNPLGRETLESDSLTVPRIAGISGKGTFDCSRYSFVFTTVKFGCPGGKGNIIGNQFIGTGPGRGREAARRARRREYLNWCSYGPK